MPLNPSMQHVNNRRMYERALTAWNQCRIQMHSLEVHYHPALKTQKRIETMKNNTNTRKHHPLEPDKKTLMASGRECLDFAVNYIDSLSGQDSQRLETAEQYASQLIENIPEKGIALKEAIRIFSDAVPFSMNTAGPGYLAYIPGGGLFESALADLLACATNRYVTIRGAAPALAQLEMNVIRWFCGLMGYGTDSMGVLTSGGSIANLSAIVTARTILLPENFLNGTIYTTHQVHHSILKAASIAGFPSRNLRTVNTDNELRMDISHLSRLINDDRKNQFSPFLIIANAGTTNTGTVDPIDTVADIAHKEGMWLHVDGAYGGFFNITKRGKTALKGIERADSITLDPHKGMFLPYGTGCILAKEGGNLKKAHCGEAAYLQDINVVNPVNFCDYSPELSRDFRGLRVWLPLKLHGLEVFRDALDEKLDLAMHAFEKLSYDKRFRIISRPSLSTIAFQYMPHRGDANEFNRLLLSKVNGEKKVFLSSTIIDGKFFIRICVLSFRTHREHVDEAVASLIRNAELVGKYQ